LPRRRVTKQASPQALVLICADLAHRACLPVLPAQAPQESRQAVEAKTVGAQDKLPIDCQSEGLLERANPLTIFASASNGRNRPAYDTLSYVVGGMAVSNSH
jgi:hypothetical protein